MHTGIRNSTRGNYLKKFILHHLLRCPLAKVTAKRRELVRDNTDTVLTPDSLEDEKVRSIYLKYFKDLLAFPFMDHSD